MKNKGHVLLRGPFKFKAMHGNTWIRIKMEDQEGKIEMKDQGQE